MSESFSITAWLEPVLGWFADQGKLNKEDYVSQTGAEAFANGIEAFADMFLSALGSKVVQTLAGIATGCYAIWGPGVGTRLKKELITLANHMEMRLIDPTPSQLVDLRKDIDNLIGGAKLGEPNMLANAFLRSTDEITKGIEALGIPTGIIPMQKSQSPVSPSAPVKRFGSF
jgi:hypothetical protein